MGKSLEQAFRLNLGSTEFFTPEMAEIQKEKPVIMGEFGAFDSIEKIFEEAVDSMVRMASKTASNGSHKRVICHHMSGQNLLPCRT